MLTLKRTTCMSMMSYMKVRERNIVWYPVYVESKRKWYKWTYSQKKKKKKELIHKTETDSQRTNLGLPGVGGEGWGEGIVRMFGRDMCIVLYLKWISYKVLLYSTGNCVQCYVAAWMGGGIWARMDTCVRMADPFVVHLKLLQHCLLDIPNTK